MKIITDNYDRIAKIECSCCREAHFIDLIMDKDDKALWFEFNEQRWGWKNKLRNWWLLKTKRESFVSGEHRNFFSVLIGRNQVSQIISLLEEKGYESLKAPECQSIEELADWEKQIGFQFSIMSTRHKVGSNYYENYFDINGLMITHWDGDGHIEISYHPTEKDYNVKEYMGSTFCMCLEKIQVDYFLNKLKTFTWI